MILDFALGYRSWIDVIVALRWLEMAEWSEDHVAVIGPLNLNLRICGRF
jgi:hypothetical protein